jgi:hypothetical protein
MSITWFNWRLFVCFLKRLNFYHGVDCNKLCITFSLQTATDFYPCVRCRSRYQPAQWCSAQWCCLIRVCTVTVHMLEYFLRKLNGFVRNERWSNTFKIFRVLRVNVNIIIRFISYSFLLLILIHWISQEEVHLYARSLNSYRANTYDWAHVLSTMILLNNNMSVTKMIPVDCLEM